MQDLDIEWDMQDEYVQHWELNEGMQDKKNTKCDNARWEY